METCFRDYQRKAKNRKSYRYTDHKSGAKAQGPKHDVESVDRIAKKAKIKSPANGGAGRRKKMPIEDMIKHAGIKYSVERKGKIISSAIGMKAKEHAINFLPDADIQVNDILKNPNGDAYFVVDVEMEYLLNDKKCLCVRYAKNSGQEKTQKNVTYNIGSVNNSVFGNENTVYFDLSIAELRKEVDEKGEEDKEKLSEIVDLLEKILNGQEKPEKGLLSRFSAVMERHSWISNSVAGTILSWLMTKIQ